MTLDFTINTPNTGGPGHPGPFPYPEGAGQVRLPSGILFFTGKYGVGWETTGEATKEVAGIVRQRQVKDEQE